MCWNEPNGIVGEPLQMVEEMARKKMLVQRRVVGNSESTEIICGLETKASSFEVGTHVWLKMFPTRGVRRLG